MKEQMSFLTMVITMFILLNSFAQVPVFIALLSRFSAKKQKYIILREMAIALTTLLIFIFFGPQVLKMIGIDKYVIGIAGGMLLLLIALNMIFPKSEATQGLPAHEPFIVPLAIPCIAGPGSITALMLISSEQGTTIAAAALLVAFIPSVITVLSSAYIKEYLGEKGLQAVERLGGMLICLIGIQMIASGVVDLVKFAFPR